METAFAGPGKRHYDSEPAERNGRNKRRDRVGPDRFREPTRGRVLLDDIVFRLLCPGQKVGSVIGKGGSIIKSLRNETGAKIKVEDAPPGAPERVVIIAASGKDTDRTRDDKSQVDRDKDETLNEKEGGETDKGREVEENSLPPVMDALFRVYGRIVEGDDIAPDVDDGDAASQSVTMRFLVPNNQIGCLLGKGGKIIQQMRSDTGAQIRILSKEQLPDCALPSDEIVQISGDSVVVKKALHAIGFRLYENPPKDRPQLGPFPVHRSSLMPSGSFGSGGFLPQGDVGSPMMGMPPPLSSLGGLGASAGASAGWPYGSSGVSDFPHLSEGRRGDSPEAELVIRILCPNDKIGGIIGKGGNIIRHIREETHASIKIADSVPNSDERVIVVSAIEILGDPFSPTLEAVLQVQSRIADLAEKDGSATFTRLLVPSINIGCLLGKGGNIISEMRKVTRANIRILPKENLPRCALESDELVQIAGDLNVARDAVIQVVTRLRTNLFKDHIGIGGNDGVLPVVLGRQGNFPLPPVYEGRHEPGSPGAMHHLSGMGYQSSSRSSFGSSPGPWPFQGAGSGVGGPPPFSGYGGGSSQQGTTYNREGRSSSGLAANVSGTTVEISIPHAAIGSIIGKGGNNITQIRQISGAKVKLHEERPGAVDRIIEISGTPEQTQAAQSLLEAFIITSQSHGGKL
ncbi:hypothetical protein O6H91_20G048700 [Diphasiastrum complanatum]|uniref:Uncharacterized protein n=1 Tax=Diphasiastrum complanatum TaxID=34168 RepID=A0ACC2ARM9_DIPCM|nr:hypothetical protein O6H91_Y174100 [Diphasiastrum complanatum]KAJ7299707.1 hypothetical protein O6H91_Y174100 [Diphasiastrum complanatum]KAJ7299708.1 hypothetical protein O6H91_Y174100 [Diphasiastrum complanatum]KAJ7299709.1 hypothetical protein O6H91_Y174100 [Diphasiastrum complanatum]KAJ7299710.1 hypothetical protein O6H91_Y174100 [Diphasiastrum complanatum]